MNGFGYPIARRKDPTKTDSPTSPEFWNIFTTSKEHDFAVWPILPSKVFSWDRYARTSIRKIICLFGSLRKSRLTYAPKGRWSSLRLALVPPVMVRPNSMTLRWLPGVNHDLKDDFGRNRGQLAFFSVPFSGTNDVSWLVRHKHQRFFIASLNCLLERSRCSSE